VRELFAHSRHPYTRGLLRSIPRIDQPRGQLPTLPGAPPDMSALPSGCRFRERCAFAQERCKARPELLAVAPGHLTRCWVAQEGISLAEAPAFRQEPVDVL
jgi:oligopeptide/dipeptide ABC transporter ATP-binding protein